MADDEVLIKIAGDVTSAVGALNTMVATLDEMAGGIGALILQVKALTEASHEAAKGHKDQEEAIKPLAVAMGELLAKSFEEVGAALGDVVMLLPNLVLEGAKAGNEMMTLANRTGMSVEAIAQMQFVADQSNVSFSVMSRSSQKLAMDLMDSSSKASQAFTTVGLSAKELAADPANAMYTFVDAVQKTVPASEQAGMMQEAFGRKSFMLTGLLKENVGQILETEKALGSSAETLKTVAEEGTRYNNIIGQIHLTQETWRNTITAALLPALNSVMEQLPALGGMLITVGEHFEAVGASVAQMMIKLAMTQNVSGTLGGLLKSIGLLVEEGWAMALSWGAAALPWIALAAAIAGVTYVIYESIGGMDGLKAIAADLAPVLMTAQEVVLSLWQTLVDFGVIIEHVSVDLIKGFIQSVEALWTSIKAFFDGFSSGSNGLLAAFKEWWTWFEKIPGIGLLFEGLHKWLDIVISELKTALEWAQKFFGFALSVYEKVTGAVHQLANEYRELDKAATPAVEAVTAAAKVAKESANAWDALYEKTDAVNAAFWSMTDAQKAAAKAAMDAGIPLKQIATVMAKDLGLDGKEGIEIATDALGLLKKEISDTKKAADASPLAKFEKELKNFSEGVTQAFSSGEPMSQMVTELGKKAEDIVVKARLIPGALALVPPKVKEIADAFEALAAKKFLAKVTADAEKSGKALDALAEKNLHKLADAFGKDLVDAINHVDQIGRDMTDNMLSQSDQRMAKIDAEERNAIAKAEGRNQNNLGLQQKEIDALRAFYDQKRALDVKYTGDVDKDQELRGVANQKDLDRTMTAERLHYDDMLAAGTKFSEEEKQAQLKRVHNAEDAANHITTATKTSLQDQVTDQYNALDKMLKNEQDYTPQQIAEQQKKYDAAKDALTGVGLKTVETAEHELKVEQDKLTEMLKLEGVYTVAQYAEQQKRVDAARVAAGKQLDIMSVLSQGMDQLGKTMGGSMGASVSQMGSSFGLLKTTMAASKVEGQQWGAMIGTFTSKGATGMDKFAAGAQGAMGLASGAMNVWAAASKSASVGLNALNAGMEGAKAGAAFGPWGMAAGFAAGAIVALIKGKPEWAKVTDDISRDFGVKVSEKLANAIASSEKEVGGDRVAASLLHLADIIGEGGGLSGTNIDKFGAKLHDTFSMFDTGKFSADQLTGVLKDTLVQFVALGQTDPKGMKAFDDATNLLFQRFKDGKITTDQLKTSLEGSVDAITKAATDSGGLVSQSFLNLAANAKAAGVEFDSLSKFNDTMFSKMASGMTTAVGSLNQYKENSEDAQASFNRLSNIALASFNAMVAGGHTSVEAISALGDTMKTLQERQETLGLGANAAFTELNRFSSLVSTNADLITSVGGLNDVMTALANTGSLNVDTFNDMQTQGVQSFKELQAAGFTQQESLAQMKPMLETMIKLHDERGMAIDGETQSMIDQAEKDGIIKAKEASTQQVLMDGLGQIIKLLGGDLPDAWKKTGDAGKAAMDDVSKASTDTTTQVVDQFNNGVTPAVEATDSALHDTNWTGYTTAATIAATAVTGQFTEVVTPAVEATDAALTATDFTGYAQNAADTAAAVAGTFTDTVQPAVEDTDEALMDKAAYDNYAAQAKAAGIDAASYISKVTDAANTVQSKLQATQWQQWAAAAMDAARQAKDAVNTVSFGSSPGGIKEIPLQLAKASAAAREFRKTLEGEMGPAYDAVNMVGSGIGLGGGGFGAAAGPSMTINVDASGSMFSDREGMRDLATEIGGVIMDRVRSTAQVQ
jgi:hypothetical protein